MPSSPEVVALYISDLATHLSVSTIRRRMAAITNSHKEAGFTNSPASPRLHYVVREVLAGIKRTLGTAQHGVDPLLADDIRRIVAATPDKLIGLRDRALVLVGFSGAFRRSELTTILEVDDLHFTDQGVHIRMRRSKTDQEGQGRTVSIPRGEHPETCPIHALQTWLDAAGITAGPVFRSVNRYGKVAGRALRSGPESTQPRLPGTVCAPAWSPKRPSTVPKSVTSLVPPDTERLAWFAAISATVAPSAPARSWVCEGREVNVYGPQKPLNLFWTLNPFIPLWSSPQMKTAIDFLAEVASLRLQTQLDERKPFRAPLDFELPAPLEVALRHRWKIVPVLARSPLAVNSASCGVPSSDREQVEFWLARYPEANWSLATGPSGVIGLEIETGLARSWLADFTEDESDWTRTLRFMCGSRRFMLFASNAGFESLAAYPGLRVHARTRILIPPSRLPNGDELAYADSHAPLLDPPNWLRIR
jgi:hypothetical protein